MSIDKVNNLFKEFLENPTPEAICVTGKWGVGKTYSWKAAIKEHGIPLEKYAYVSLFGVNSLDELKASIFENTVNKNDINKRAGLNTLGELFNLKGNAFRQMSKFKGFLGAFRIPESVLTRATFLSISDQVICIDDYERKGDGISSKDVLGLMSYLKEERKCKIVLLLNENAIEEDESDSFKTHVKKAVDRKVTFAPTSEEALKISNIDDNTETAEKCKCLNITNIRILNKIEDTNRRALNDINTVDPRIISQVIHTISLLVWSKLDIIDAPNLEHIKSRNFYKDMFEKEKEISVDQAKWNTVLDAYDFRHMDDLDYLLLEGIENGFFSSSQLDITIKEMEKSNQETQSTERLHKAWSLFHDSFDDNQDQVATELFEASKESLGNPNIASYNGAVKLLRELNRDDLADQLIKFYVDKYKDDAERLNINSMYHLERIDDPGFVSACNARLESINGEPTCVISLLKEVSKNELIDSQQLSELSSLTRDDFYNAFKELKGGEQHAAIKTLLRYAAGTDEESVEFKIHERVIESLKRIAEESLINKSRVKRYLPSES